MTTKNDHLIRATKKQIQILHTILSNRGLLEMKPQIVSDASDGRTEHASELDVEEMAALIKRLSLRRGEQVSLSVDRAAEHKMKRRILSLCYTIGWTVQVPPEMSQKVDYVRLDQWLIKYGYLHKPLNDYRYDELTKLVTQFENFAKSTL